MNCGSDNRERCSCAIEEDTPVSLTVIECVSEADGRDPNDRPPLHEAIDPEALDDLFRGRSGGEVTFTYQDYEITVDGDAVTATKRPVDRAVRAD